LIEKWTILIDDQAFPIEIVSTGKPTKDWTGKTVTQFDIEVACPICGDSLHVNKAAKVSVAAGQVRQSLKVHVTRIHLSGAKVSFSRA